MESLYINAIWGGKPSGLKKISVSKPVVKTVMQDYSDGVTVFESIYNTSKAKYMTLSDIVKRIKNGNSKDMIHKFRAGQSDLKMQLPAICFSGIFATRSNEGLIKHSGLVCLDFDKVPDVEKFKENICKCKYVRSAFISPSGNGVKVIIKIEGDHKEVIHKLDKYFDSEYLDLQDDICRVCFESSDENIYHNPNSIVFNGN